ncbi:hypothetical protein BJX68DRAFT_224322 [Aspergillus pseudodeflectus]|uniref:Uncharacterized protein n=1 Tax=Aspergillus pseudodeflectus TaxID=176178 RepID=A0ABR4L6W6_9EURO
MRWELHAGILPSSLGRLGGYFACFGLTRAESVNLVPTPTILRFKPGYIFQSKPPTAFIALLDKFDTFHTTPCLYTYFTSAFATPGPGGWLAPWRPRVPARHQDINFGSRRPSDPVRM